MIAALGMYDPRWLHDANNRLWQALADRLREAGWADLPDHLCRTLPLAAIWTEPRLVLAQTCGYPLTMQLGSTVALVATPIYGAPGCAGAWHRSAIIVRQGDRADTLKDLAGRSAAINARDSNTGMNLLRARIAPLAQGARFFERVIETGSHARSVWAVIAGRADTAAIDAVTLALLHDRYPALARRIRVLDWTMATPGLPLITARAGDVALLRRVLGTVVDDPALAASRAALRLTGMAVVDRAAYAIIPALETGAVQAGYPYLA
jgi:ABC-type phosphate/phosphonate transport system substrate-binding protein